MLDYSPKSPGNASFFRGQRVAGGGRSDCDVNPDWCGRFSDGSGAGQGWGQSGAMAMEPCPRSAQQ